MPSIHRPFEKNLHTLTITFNPLIPCPSSNAKCIHFCSFLKFHCFSISQKSSLRLKIDSYNEHPPKKSENYSLPEYNVIEQTFSFQKWGMWAQKEMVPKQDQNPGGQAWTWNSKSIIRGTWCCGVNFKWLRQLHSCGFPWYSPNGRSLGIILTIEELSLLSRPFMSLASLATRGLGSRSNFTFTVVCIVLSGLPTRILTIPHTTRSLRPLFEWISPWLHKSCIPNSYKTNII